MNRTRALSGPEELYLVAHRVPAPRRFGYLKKSAALPFAVPWDDVATRSTLSMIGQSTFTWNERPAEGPPAKPVTTGCRVSWGAFSHMSRRFLMPQVNDRNEL